MVAFLRFPAGLRFRPRDLLAVLVFGLTLVIAVVPTVEAQRGLGRGRQRPPEPGGTSRDDPYGLDGPSALRAIVGGQGQEALAAYERTATDAEQHGETVRAARAWHAASMVARRLGRYQKSIQAGIRAIEAFRRANSLADRDLAAWASTYAQISGAYRAVGDLPRARQSLEEGLELSRTRLSGWREGQSEGFLLNELALIAHAQHDYQSELARSTEAARFFETVAGQLPPRAPDRARSNISRWTANALLGIGRSQLALGRPDRAAAALDQGLKYARLSGVWPTELEVLAAQGNLALARQEWTKALGLYEECIVGSVPLGRAGALPGLYEGKSRALDGLGRGAEAMAAARESVRRTEDVRAHLGDAGLRSGFFEDKQRFYHHAIALAVRTGQLEEAFVLAERSRSRTFLDLLGSQTPLSKGRTRALVDEEVRLRARLAEAQALAQDSDGGDESEQARSRVEALDRDYRAFLERVRKENIEQASLMAVEPVTLAEIQRLLPAGTTLLEYLVVESGIVMWVVDRERFTFVGLPGDRASLIGEVRRFRTDIGRQAPLADIHANAERLYQRLLAPARAAIRGDRLVIVPHGVLHYLPFAALRSQAGRWLVEDFALSTLPSASVLRYLIDKGAGAPARALVAGNPDVGSALALPWAEREARMVGQHERDAVVLVRGDATEAKIKKQIGAAGLVHFATHGELDESDPLSSAVLLAPGDGEDGRLEVREVFGLDLHARLVVLSACETGLGKLSRGDELLGLQRAFLYAGTPAVVTTLWKVDDRASYELVRAFYDRLDTLGVVAALRHAQLETMRAFAHPYAWAAFAVTAP